LAAFPDLDVGFPELYKYAGQKVAVKGKLSADKLTVDSVTPAK
jgi:hypothetical protein